MKIKLFTALTTDDAISEIEANSKKYHVGFFADMNNAPERKIVKESAATIQTLIKKMDRARIDLAKDYKVKVEAEAKEIIGRLKVANEPFTLLIDEFNAERKKELDADKARKKAIEEAVKLEADHDYALILNINWDNEIDKRRRDAAALEERRRAEQDRREQLASDRAVQEEKDRQQRAKDLAEKEEAARLDNNQYLAAVHRSIWDVLIDNKDLDLSVEQAKTVVKLIVKGTLPKVIIKY